MQGLKRKAALPESPTFEIRARPLDCEKRLPLVFTSEEERRVDPGLPGDDSLGAAPLDTPPRAMAASPSPLAAYFVGCGASSSSGLYRTYSRDSFSHAGADDEITVPLFTALADWEAFPRQFTRPPELIKGRPPVEEDLVEYEMDLDDEKWLADWNQHNPGTLIEVDDFELYLDRLEKARARPAPRGGRDDRAPREQHAPPPSSHLGAPSPGGAQASFRALHAHNLAERAARAALPPSLSTSHHSAVARKKRPQSEPKNDKPPPPRDDELIDLPTGLCKRYQQGRCHKGRSCKWKHEIWPALQQKWDEWHRSVRVPVPHHAHAHQHTLACAHASARTLPHVWLPPISHTLDLSFDARSRRDALRLLASRRAPPPALPLRPPPNFLRPPPRWRGRRQRPAL